MKYGILVAGVSLAIACGSAHHVSESSSPSVGSGPADAGTPADPAPVGGNDGGTAAPPAPQVGPTSYQLVDPGLSDLSVVNVSRGGKVLLMHAYSDPRRVIYDIATGTVRDAPAQASAVNDSGMTAGVRPAGKDATGQCDDSEVFVAAPDGTTRGLGNPVYGDYGTIPCGQRGGVGVDVIDQQGRPVVAWRSDSSTHPGGTFRWNGSGWDRLQPVGAFIGGISAINDSGDLAGGGGSSQGGTIQHAGVWHGDTMTEIGTFGGTVSYARAINEAGQVAGYATRTPGVNDEVPFIWKDGVLQPLGLPAGYEIGEAYGIADDGSAAGEAISRAPYLGFHGMLWSGGATYDLNDLIDTHDWLVTSVAGMTRSGDIVAYALNRQMQSRVVALVRKGPPVPDRSWRGGGTVLAEGQGASWLAVDSGRVYWKTEQFNGKPWQIRSVAKTGGSVTTVTEHEGYASGLLADGVDLWFSGCIDPTTCSSAIWRLPASGGTAQAVAPGGTQFAVAGGLVFSKDRSGQNGIVYRTPLNGTASVIDTMAIVYRWPGPVSGLAVDARDVYYTWTAPDETVTVRAQPLGGGPTRDLFPGEARFQNAARLQVDGGYVYLQARQEIVRVPSAGGGVQKLAHVGGQASVAAMEVRDGSLWWTVPASENGEGCLWRADADGANAAEIECGPWDYGGLTVDASGVYTVRDLQIVRFPR